VFFPFSSLALAHTISLLGWIYVRGLMLKKYSSIIKNGLVFIISVTVLTLGFYQNEWRAAGKKWFYDWKDYQQFMLVGRLVETRQNGVLSHSGFIGIGDGDNWLDANADLVQHQMDVYLNSGAFEKFSAYDTEPAFYSIIFGLIDELTDFSPGLNLKIFRAISSFLTATALALFIVWVGIEFNLFAAGLTLLFSMVSEWLALAGGSMYWNLWVYYLPFLCVLFYLLRVSHSGKYSFGKLFLIVYVSVFVTGLFRGFLFITTTLIMLTVPLVYYALRDKWSWPIFAKRMFQIGISAMISTFSALMILILQITLEKNSFGAALAHIQDSLLKRSVGNPDQFGGILAESLRASTLDVLMTYLQGRAINLNSVFSVRVSWFEITYLSIFAFFAISSILFFLKGYLIGRSTKHNQSLALIFATWFSALAPLSWLIMFKAHSYIHTQMNFMLWQMPFALFGFAMCGFVLSNLFQATSSNEKMA
jgi:hypothetical protein